MFERGKKALMARLQTIVSKTTFTILCLDEPLIASL
jgi:hypothetical protein